jgi:hypothetical protein
LNLRRGVSMIPNRKERTSGAPTPRKKPPAHPTIGQPFNPCREICGFYPPDIVARQTDLADGPKRLYERSVRWAGSNGAFWYSFETMATELGKCSRQVKRDMAKLERYGLLAHERRGKRRSNLYRFLYHPVFESDGTSRSLHPDGGVTDSTGDGTSASLGAVTRMSHESCKGNSASKSSSQDAEVSANARIVTRTDDEFLVSEESEPQTPGVLGLAGFGLKPGSEDPLTGTRPLPRWFLQAAAHKIHASRCYRLGIGVDLALFPPPDIAFTAKILEPWRGKGSAAFSAWVCSTVERELGRKGKAVGPFVYGLFLSDSEGSARTWELNRPISQKRPMPGPPASSDEYPDARDYLARIENQ